MTLQQISIHERRGMWMREVCGYDQSDDHVWRWLNHHLRTWGERHPIKVMMPEGKNV